MEKNRLEAFSDGVIAIIITIMVLEMKVPHGAHDLEALRPIIPVFMSYALSFIYIGIYWNNHHHMFQAVKHVGGWVLWANLHLLFWLSLLPFATGWMGENHFAAIPMALYALDLGLCGWSRMSTLVTTLRPCLGSRRLVLLVDTVEDVMQVRAQGITVDACLPRSAGLGALLALQITDTPLTAVPDFFASIISSACSNVIL